MEKKRQESFEVTGVKGLKNTPFRKVFKSEESYEVWLDKNEGDIEVYGFRYLEESK